MLESVEGIYEAGHIKLLEAPKTKRRSRVVVTFLSDEPQDEVAAGIVCSGEILCDDLEEASREISKMFADAIDRSGEEALW
jgi:hypothetical protein